MHNLRPLIALAFVAMLAACDASAASVPPTATPIPPTATLAPPTVTLAPPTATLAPPTATLAPPTATLAPPTATLAPTSAPSPTAAASLSAPVRLVIASINLDRSLTSVGLDRQRVPIVPDHEVGWYNLSARLGEGENIVLWGHVLRFRATPNIPAPFARLRELAVGAEIILYNADGAARRYLVARQVWATPDQVAYILPQGREMLTMVSCIGAKVVVDNSLEMSHRLITIAEPAGS